jgi:hypothetical protein
VKRGPARACAGWARRGDFLNELSDLQRAVIELRDRVAADYLSHAAACYAKGRDQAGEVWLRLAVERLRA